MAVQPIWAMIFFERSPRYVTLEKAQELSAYAADRIIKVAVTVDADDQLLDQIVEKVKPDMLQFHGNETPEQIFASKARYGLPVVKAIPVRESGDLEWQSPTLVSSTNFFLMQSHRKVRNFLAVMVCHLTGRLCAEFDLGTPYMLSGGLDVQNIEDAIALSDAVAIDVSSGVECAPGEKDISKIEAFLTKIKQSEKTGSNA